MSGLYNDLATITAASISFNKPTLFQSIQDSGHGGLAEADCFGDMTGSNLAFIF
jgi:hypothetical protein